MRENLLLTVGLYEWGAVQILSGSSDNEHVPIVQYAVAGGQGFDYGEYFVPQGVEGGDHGDTKAPQADNDELPVHRPPTWIAGRRSGLGSASRSTSWVTGAVSPSPNRM